MIGRGNRGVDAVNSGEGLAIYMRGVQTVEKIASVVSSTSIQLFLASEAMV